MESFEPVISDLEKHLKTESDKRTLKSLNCLIGVFKELDARQVHPRELNDELKELKPLLSEPLKPHPMLKIKSKVLRVLSKKFGFVVKGHYQTLWMVLGMTTFGLPFGMLFGLTMDNMGMFGIGLPIGMTIGIAVGAGLDRKAAAEGKVMAV